MGAYDCDCINNLEYDRRERKQKEQSRSTVSTAQSTAQSTNLIERQATIDAVNNAFDRETLLTGFVRSIAVRAIRDMPSVQPELIEKTAYIRGFKQGRTQGMIDSQGGRNE